MLQDTIFHSKRLFVGNEKSFRFTQDATESNEVWQKIIYSPTIVASSKHLNVLRSFSYKSTCTLLILFKVFILQLLIQLLVLCSWMRIQLSESFRSFSQNKRQIFYEIFDFITVSFFFPCKTIPRWNRLHIK